MVGKILKLAHDILIEPKLLCEPSASLAFAKRMSGPFLEQFQSQMQKYGCTIPGHLSLSYTKRWVCPALMGI